MLTHNHSGAIAKGLEEIRRRRRSVWIVFFLYFPVVGVAFAISQSEHVAMGVAFAWAALYLFAGIRVDVSKCPRCGRRFHRKRYFANPWSGKCLHCGLRLRGEAHA